MKLEEVIRQRLAEASKQLDESKKTVELKAPESAEEKKEGSDVVDLKPSVKKEKLKEDTDVVAVETPVIAEEQVEKKVDTTVSSQVSALLEAEGLSEEFKLQAVTIFEAAVTDRVLQIEEELKTQFDTQLAEAKAELESDIDEFLSEAVKQWQTDNEVAIKANFNTQVAESFMDGLRSLIAEHNIEVPEGKEDALEAALSEVEKVNESLKAKDAEKATLQEQVNELTAKQILESFKEKMSQIEFDRFVQLTESVKFVDAEQYDKQLKIVLENFGSSKKAPIVEQKTEIISEDVMDAVKVVSTVNSNVSAYAAFLSKKR